MNLLRDTLKHIYQTYMGWYQFNTLLYLDRLEKELRLEK